MPTTRQQRRARARSPLKKGRRGAVAFLVFMLLVVLGGGYLITLARTNPAPLTRGASVGEHWHASYRIYLCGMRLANYPTVEGDVHSHGDGFIHVHPSSPITAGDNANLGAFLRTFETSIGVTPDGKRTLIFPDGTTLTDGDTCPGEDEPHDIEVLNKGEPITGDPAEFVVHEGDAIVIRFGPEGEELLPNPYSMMTGIQDPGMDFPDAPAPEGEEEP